MVLGSEQRARAADRGRARGLRFAAVTAFAAYLLTGFLIHDDFGVSWDEEINRDLGRRTFEYVAARAEGEPVSWARMSKGLVVEFGPFFETVLYSVEHLLALEDSADIYRTRHLVTFLAFWLGTVAFYTYLRERFDDRAIALAATALLALAPRLFAHSFYNSKDAVIAAMFMMGMLTMRRFAERPTLLNTAAHALVCSAAVGVRVAGVLLPAVTVVLVVLAVAGEQRDRRRWAPALAWLSAYGALFAALAFLFWPGIWDDPVRVLQRTITGSVAARQHANAFVLYLGEFVPVTALPWHYVPVWMLITVPPVTLVLVAAGLTASIRRFAAEPPTDWENAQSIAVLLLLFLPLAAAIVLRPVLYDDWRHLYFLYPPLAALAASGLRAIGSSRMLRIVAPVLAVAGVAHGAFVLARTHPYGNVYFNVLAGGDVESTYELDYWGLSFREGLEYVLSADPSDEVKVSASDYPGVLNSKILDRAHRDRLRFGPLAEADWFLTNHRQPNHYADFRARRFPCVDERYAVRVGDATLLGVFRVR